MNTNAESRNQTPSDEQLSASLRELPQLEPSASLYARLHTISRESAALPKKRRAWPAGLVAASLMIAGLLIWVPEKYSPTGSEGLVAGEVAGPAGESAGAPPAGASVSGDAVPLNALMAQSAYLESLLASIPGERRVQRVGTASTISAIEDRVALIDQQLSQPIVQADAAGSTSLWRQRVGLMNTLVELRAKPSGQIWL